MGTWSVQTNLPQWNRALGVSRTRQGCSNTPAACLQFVGGVAKANGVKVFLAIPLNATTTADYASQYSQLSLNAPYLVEVGIDDFVDQYAACIHHADVSFADEGRGLQYVAGALPSHISARQPA